MDEKKKKTDEQNKDAEKKAPKTVEDVERLKQWARMKMLTVAVTLLACSILMLYLMVDKPSEAELIILDYAQEHGISALQYPESLVKLLESNPETESFVLNYPFREENPEIDFSAVNLKSGVPTFMQWDKRWGYLEYGGDFVGVSGDGPMCLAMVGYYLTGDARFHPDRVVEFANENELYAASSSKWALINIGSRALDLDVLDLAPVENKVADYLQADIPLIAAMNPGKFGDEECYIVFKSYKDGMVTVIDPSSFENSREWSFAEIKGQIAQLWALQEKQ